MCRMTASHRQAALSAQDLHAAMMAHLRLSFNNEQASDERVRSVRCSPAALTRLRRGRLYAAQAFPGFAVRAAACARPQPLRLGGSTWKCLIEEPRSHAAGRAGAVDIPHNHPAPRVEASVLAAGAAS